MTLLRRPPRLTKWDILWTILPALAWLGAVFARPVVITPKCVANPSSCDTAKLSWPDRVWVHAESHRADELSFVTQDLSGAVAVAIPLLWNSSLAVVGALSPAAALTSVGIDTLLLVQTAVWNGLATETARLIVQRPRPFVYANPGGFAGDTSNYTSFYSGHTSFSAAMGAGLIATLLGRGSPPLLLGVVAIIASLLTCATAVFRVMAGRHFFTDVIFGTLAGLIVGVLVARLHRPSRIEPASRA